MQSLQLISISPDQLKTAIIEGVKLQLEELKSNFQPKEPKRYLTRAEVSEMLSIDLSSVHNWTKKGILTAHQIGGRVYYLRSEVEEAIVKLEN